MSVSLIIPFDNPSNFIFDINKIEIALGLASLKLINDPDQEFQVDFDSDTGMNYNASLVNFAGAFAEQIDQRPANSILGATYDDSLNANWAADGFVSLDAIINGTPVLSGGKVVCNGPDGVCYSDAIIGNLSGNLVIKHEYYPDYDIGPPQICNIVAISQITGGTDDIVIFHSPVADTIRITANGLSAVTFDTFNVNIGQKYIFEVHVVNNVVTLIVDDVQIGTPKTITPAQGTDSVLIHIGAYSQVYNFAKGAFKNLILYSTASKTSSYTIPQNIYLESSITTPELEYTGPGTLIIFDSFFSTATGEPRFTLQIGQSGDYLYWDTVGSAWSVSDGTYLQATNSADFNTFGPQLSVSGEVYGQFKVHFPDSNNQTSITTFIASLTAQIFSLDNPTLEIAQDFQIEELLNFLENVNKSGLDDIRYNLKKDNHYYYYSITLSAWVVADGTYIQTNSVAEIIANIDTFTTTSVSFNVKLFFHSENGETTPAIDQLEIVYDFSGDTQDNLNICDVWWYSRDPDGSVCDERIYAILNKDVVKYKDNVKLCKEKIFADINENTGYAEFNLIENSNMVDLDGGPVLYNIYGINRGLLFQISVPDQDGALLWDIIV